jgi:hypothetical protein
LADIASAIKSRVLGRLEASSGGLRVPGLVCDGCEELISMPLGSAPLAVSKGPSSTELFIASVFTWRIWHVNVTSAAVTLIYEAPSKNPMADVPIDGLAYDPINKNLWACGSLTGKMTVFKLTPKPTGSYTAAVLSVFPLTEPGATTLLTEVEVFGDRVFVTDAFNPVLYTLPSKPPAAGEAAAVQAIRLLGDEQYQMTCVAPCVPPFDELLNGISVVSRDTVLLSHSRRISVFRATINYTSSTADMLEMPLPRAINGGGMSFADNLRYVGNGAAWVADTFSSRLLRLQFSPDFSSVAVNCVVAAPSLNTAADFGFAAGRVWAMNARLLDCPLGHCPKAPFTLVGFKPEEVCV